MIEKICEWIAWHLPRRIVYHAVIRAGVHATVGQWSSDDTPAVLGITILDRWDR